MPTTLHERPDERERAASEELADRIARAAGVRNAAEAALVVEALWAGAGVHTPGQ